MGEGAGQDRQAQRKNAQARSGNRRAGARVAQTARGVGRVSAQFGLPVVNAILTTETDEQAQARADEKGRDAARVAVEMANLMLALDEDGAESDE